MTATPQAARVFTVDVPGIGAFTFRRRTLGDDIRIMALYDAMLGGVAQPSALLDSLATAVSTLRVLATTWPSDAWHPERLAQMDVLEDDRTSELLQVFGALSAREDEFRPPQKRRFQAPRPEEGEQPRDVVPPPLPPAAD